MVAIGVRCPSSITVALPEQTTNIESPGVPCADDRFPVGKLQRRRGRRNHPAVLGAQRRQQIDGRDQTLALGDLRLDVRRRQVPRHLDLDRIRNLDVVPAERVVDGAGTWSRALSSVSKSSIQNLHVVVDRRGVELGQHDLRRGRGQHERTIGDRLLDDSLDAVRRRVVGHADLDRDSRRRGRFRVVGDRLLADDVVGQDDEVAGLGAQLGGAPGDLRDAPFEVPDPDPVADVERLLALDREAGESRCRACPAARSRARRRSTADVARNLSPNAKVAISISMPMTIASWTIEGKRSGTRSARSGLMSTTTSRLISAAAKAEPLETVKVGVDPRRERRASAQRRDARRRRHQAGISKAAASAARCG